MNGTVLPQSPVAIDFWYVRKAPLAKLFLLTHMHGDHIQGLTASWRNTIYCSHVTKKLLIHRLKVNTRKLLSVVKSL